MQYVPNHSLETTQMLNSGYAMINKTLPYTKFQNYEKIF